MSNYSVVEEFVIEPTGAVSQTIMDAHGKEVTYVTDSEGVEYEEEFYYKLLAWFL